MTTSYPPAIGDDALSPEPGALLLDGSGRGGMRLRTQLALRWLAIAGQSAAIFCVHVLLGFEVPLLPCVGAIIASAAFNIWLMFHHSSTHRLSKKEAALYHAYDLLQLAVLVYFTGGLENPFSLLFIVPVTISATALPLSYTIALGALSLILISSLAFFHEPLPWWPGRALIFPKLYIAGVWVSLVLGIVFIAAYAWRIVAEAARMSAALNATQAVLARAQRLSALDGLAAAAAHELGTPLGTIAVVANELKRELPPDSAHGEDIALLASQADRCREILARLSARPEAGDAHFAHLGLDVLIAEMIEPYRGLGIEIETRLRPLSEDVRPPQFLRRPDIIYGLGNLIENAVDFAQSRVIIDASWDAERVRVTVSDDGPGFSPDILDRLGEPYVTSRPVRTAFEGDDEHTGMGLGFFIAKTLLERAGGQLHISKQVGPQTGASITVTWSRPQALQASRDNTLQL